MKFSTQNLLSIRDWQTHAEVYQNAVTECRLADELGIAVVIAPFEHPLRIAEEWAEIDILSGGRLEFGLGRGYQPSEFRGLGVSMEATRERFDESLEIVRLAGTT